MKFFGENGLKSYKYKGHVYSINGGRHFFTPIHRFKTVDDRKSLDPIMSMKDSMINNVKLLKVGDILLTTYGAEVV